MDLDRPVAQEPYEKLGALPSFELSSSDLQPGEPMPARFAYEGAADGAENVSAVVESIPGHGLLLSHIPLVRTHSTATYSRYAN